MSDHEIKDEDWAMSDSPLEDFEGAEGANENGEWPVEIIGEEVAYGGKVIYEACWENWERPDGSNNTTDNTLLSPDLIRAWESRQRKKRREMAAESLDIEIWSNLDIHNRETRLRAQAYEEKLAIAKRHPCDLNERMAKNLADKAADSSAVGRHLRLTAARRQTTEVPSSVYSSGTLSLRKTPARSSSSITSSSTTGMSKKRGRPVSTPMTSMSPIPVAMSPAVSPHTTTVRPMSTVIDLFADDEPEPTKWAVSPESSTSPPKKKRGCPPSKPSLPQSSSSDDIIEIMPPPSKLKKEAFVLLPSPATPVLSEKARGKLPEGRNMRLRSSELSSPLSTKYSSSKPRNRRKIIQDEWNKIIRRHHAAPITFVNEIDEEELPLLPPNFRYIESNYYDPYKLKPHYDADFFTRCEGCVDCDDVNDCGCQDASKSFHSEVGRVFAYTKDGLYSFKVHRSVEVIECNKYCSCDVNQCLNRVAQKPRDIPIEIFKTKDRGWGVRSSVDVPRGKVLGIYSGKLITRNAASNLLEDLAAYCFDLDGFEDPDEEAPEGACTVDSRVCGNWTRFINHSCAPNLDIYFVVYDTIPETHHPYIAFIAKKPISAGTEFTFDYVPNAKRIKPNKKGEILLPEGAKPCFCGHRSCRGFYTL